MSVDKKFLTKESKAFCMLPWIHVHTQADGLALPCCNSGLYETGGVGNSRDQNLDELINSDGMKKLRLNMLANVKTDGCKVCYKQEEHNIRSARQSFNEEYEQFFDSTVPHTADDGTISEFKMRFFDVRFRNICNFKCRTCGAAFSSQWELEDKKSNVSWYKPILKNDRPEFFHQIKDQIQHIKTAYFAGGEPLITEEHYLLLEEMIRLGRKDIKLTYSTNLSTLNYKDRDLFSLWKYFDNKIDVWASIDHVKEKAEYIRHGTDWALIETNFKKVRKFDNVDLKMNTVLSVFNYLTIDEFYQYLVDNHMYDHLCFPYSIYVANTPAHTSAHILPFNYKQKGHRALTRASKFLFSKNFNKSHVEPLSALRHILFSDSQWTSVKEEFKSEIIRLDNLRNENFSKVFPELEGLMDL